MNLRLGLYQLAQQHRLDAQRIDTLERCAGLRQQPPGVERAWVRSVAVLAAALIGVGLVLWIAANWQALGRFGRFALLEGVVVLACMAALLRPAARVPLGLMGLLAIGGLFAYFGQTYQTGADPWQLFALWALLALPLCLAVRSDVLWAPWALVAVTAVALWVYAHTAHRWRVEPQDLQVHLMGWSLALGIVLALGPALQRHSGAGVWARRTAVTLMVVMVCATALGGLFHREVAAQYWLGLALLAAAALALSLPRGFEIFGLSAAALGLNVLLVGGLVRWLFDDHDRGEPIGELLLTGLVAAGLLAATVHLVLRLAKQQSRSEGSLA